MIHITSPEGRVNPIRAESVQSASEPRRTSAILIIWGLMPVSHAHRFIFIHVPKAGGLSMMEAFRSAGIVLEYDGRGLWAAFGSHPGGAQLLARFRRAFKIAPLTSFQQQHLPAGVLRELLPKAVWATYFKFGFVRNPWDLLVSIYHYLKHRATAPEHQQRNPDIHELIRRSPDFDSYVRLCSLQLTDLGALLYDDEGNNLMDFVGRYERIEEDFASVCRKIGVDIALPHLNRSEHAKYRDYYTAETKAIVSNIFARDIERFGYEF